MFVLKVFKFFFIFWYQKHIYCVSVSYHNAWIKVMKFGTNDMEGIQKGIKKISNENVSFKFVE